MIHIPCQRHRFAMPHDVHYLNCAYMSPLADSVIAAVNAGAALKQRPWEYRAADFFAYPESFRQSAARIVGSDPGSIAIIPSASYGLAIAAKNLPLKAGQQIVVLAHQFPSNLYVWRERAARTGASIITVQREAGAAWTAAVLDAINPDTAIVAVPNCHWADGGVVDLVAVGAACRRVGAALVLDLTQSLGALPFNAAEVQPDFMVAACYKWLMGPYGTGILYVAPQHQGGAPIEQTWMGRAGSEDFTRLTDYRDDYQDGARRFDMGEKSNPALLLGAKAGIDMLLDWGIEAISATLGAMTTGIAKAATDIGLSADPIGVRAPHFLSLAFPGDVPAGLTDRLAAKSVHVSLRGSSLRVTPHLYNDQADCDALISALKN